MRRSLVLAALAAGAAAQFTPSSSASPSATALASANTGVIMLTLGVPAGTPEQFDTDEFSIATQLRLGIASAFDILTTGTVPNVDGATILSTRACGVADVNTPCTAGVTSINVALADPRGVRSEYDLAINVPVVFNGNASASYFAAFTLALQNVGGPEFEFVPTLVTSGVGVVMGPTPAGTSSFRVGQVRGGRRATDEGIEGGTARGGPGARSRRWPPHR